MRIGELVQSWRWWNKYSVREAAGIIGVTPSTLSRIERGLPMSDEHLALLVRWVLSPGA